MKPDWQVKDSGENSQESYLQVPVTFPLMPPTASTLGAQTPESPTHEEGGKG